MYSSPGRREVYYSSLGVPRLETQSLEDLFSPLYSPYLIRGEKELLYTVRRVPMGWMNP